MRRAQNKREPPACVEICFLLTVRYIPLSFVSP